MQQNEGCSQSHPTSGRCIFEAKEGQGLFNFSLFPISAFSKRAWEDTQKLLLVYQCSVVSYSLRPGWLHVACQSPRSMEFFRHEYWRHEYWSRLPIPSPGDLPDPGIKPGSPALEADSLPSEPPGNIYGLCISLPEPNHAFFLQGQRLNPIKIKRHFTTIIYIFHSRFPRQRTVNWRAPGPLYVINLPQEMS